MAQLFEDSIGPSPGPRLSGQDAALAANQRGPPARLVRPAWWISGKSGTGKSSIARCSRWKSPMSSASRSKLMPPES